MLLGEVPRVDLMDMQQHLAAVKKLSYYNNSHYHNNSDDGEY